MKRSVWFIVVTIFALVAFAPRAAAQFKETAFSQNYEDSSNTQVDTTYQGMFSFKELFGGVAHKRPVRIGTLMAGSIFMPGLSQIHNEDYWKLPIFYAGMGTCVGFGAHYMGVYNKSVTAYNEAFALDPYTTVTTDKTAQQLGTWLLVGAGLFYWGSLMDGMVNFHKEIKHSAGKATVYSALLPGLGQAYNGEYWKIPIYWGCLLGAGHYYYTNNLNYQRFRRIYNASFDDDYSGPISQSVALYYRNIYREYRDYSVLAIVAFYLLQVIDANVFAYMHDFEVNDDLSLKIEPVVIGQDDAFASSSSIGKNNAVGLKFGFTF